MSKHVPRKRFGQNFLRDDNIIAQIVASIAPQPGDRIIEIGPGQGALTEPLMQHTGRLEVIELDRDLIPLLKNKFAYQGEIIIYNQDVLTFDFASLSQEANSLRVVGNLPYNISTPLLFHLVSFQNIIQDMHFMLQKEVVDRICAHPHSKDYGRLSVMMQYYCHAEHLFNVPPEAFYPPPKVDSAIIRLIPRSQLELIAEDEKSLAKIVQASFAQRRKTLRNNLKTFLSDEQIKSLGIDPGCRAETLSLNDFVALANSYHQASENTP